MKLFASFFLLGLSVVTFTHRLPDEQSLREKRWFWPQKCTKDSDCGEGRCCLNPNYFGFCASKPGIDDSCNFVGFTRCFCKDGLSCQTVKKWRWGTTTLAWNRCR
ncbi:unnamed protein product, partial [Porites lobata]